MEVVEHDVESGLVLLFGAALALAALSLAATCARDDGAAGPAGGGGPGGFSGGFSSGGPTAAGRPRGQPGSYGTQKRK